MAEFPKDLLALEKQFWTGDEAFYRENVDRSCLVAFAEMAGVMGNDEIAATVRDGNRWTQLELLERGFLQPTPDVALLTYEAKAERADGRPDAQYLGRVRQRFGQWIRDTCSAQYDRAWLDYQHEIGLRHTAAKKNRTDAVASAAPQIHLRYLIAFIVPITAAAPDISNFILSISAEGLIEMPPVSNVTPFPTRTMVPLEDFARFSKMINCGGKLEPCETARTPPILSRSISLFPNTLQIKLFLAAMAFASWASRTASSPGSSSVTGKEFRSSRLLVHPHRVRLLLPH